MSRKRPTSDENQLREPKHPRIQIDRTDGSTMEVDGSNMDSDDSTMDVDCLIVLPPSPSPCSSPSCIQFNVNTTQDDELNEMVDNMELGLEACDNVVEVTGQVLAVTSTVLGVASDVTKNFAVFAPLISTFLNVGKEIIILYKKAEHHKELCSFLLNRCKCAIVAVRDLNTKKIEHADFFSKQENFDLFVEFVKCMQRIQEFIADVSQLKKFKKFLHANNIEEKFNKLVNEFDGYMSSLNFTFTMQSKDDLTTIKNEIKQIKEILLHYGVSDDKQSQEIFFDRMNLITEKNEEFQRQTRENKNLDDSQFKALEENEPLLDGNKYQKTNICPSKRIVKRMAINSYDEYCFKEFSNNPPFSVDQSSSNNEETQIEIRRQVNILKELKNSDHIIRFYGVAQEESKYYLVTEWMEHGNLHEYYTKFKDTINLKTKIKFALDICRGVAYLHSCEILHRDIQSANILVNGNDKVRIANFGLSRKFHDITRNISHNLENIRYMAPEKLNNDVKKRKAYDSKCEIYSVGALLWEIAELKKPHADLDKSEAIVKIRKRVEEKYRLPFSKEIPYEWVYIVTKAMEYEPAWRYSISEICREFYNLSMKYLTSNLENGTMDKDRKASTVTILPVKDAINEHKSKNGDKQLAWQSFKYHSSTDIEAKYWLGYYYYHEEIPELQEISKEERVKIAADIFKETADKGNASAQLRYGMFLLKGEGVGQNSFEALKYLKSAANLENAAAMYVIGKAYLSGSNGIERDENLGVKYLKEAASRNHDKARQWCNENNVAF